MLNAEYLLPSEVMLESLNYKERERVRERKRESDRQTDRDREKDRETESQTENMLNAEYLLS